MRGDPPDPDRSSTPSCPAVGDGDLPGAVDLLRVLLSLPPDVAERVRLTVPRRRTRHRQCGPSADLG